METLRKFWFPNGNITDARWIDEEDFGTKIIKELSKKNASIIKNS